MPRRLPKQSTQIFATRQVHFSSNGRLFRLTKIDTYIAASGIPEEQKQKMMVNLAAAKQEAAEQEPNKELMGANLKKVGETMKALKETTEAGKSLWQTGGEILKAIAPFVGLAVGIWG